jgi:predicted dienelactone hydrolase
MRTLEKLIVVLALPALLWLLDPQLPPWIGLFAVVAAILVPIHARLEGMHWQMAPAYVAVGILLLSEPGVPLGRTARLCCGIVVCLLLASTLAFSWALPMFKLPKPTGKYPVGTRLLHLVDLSRAEMHPGAWPGNREVVVQLWYPAATEKGPKAMYRMKGETSFVSSYQSVLATDAIQDAPLALNRFPVIVHNDGWHGLRHRATSLTQEIASQGFVFVSVSHPYNSSMVRLSDGRVANPDYGHDIGFSLHHYIPLKERFALAEEELAIQTRDCKFVLDELQRFNQTVGHPFYDHLQMDRVGVSGFSFGGAVSMELAREDARVCSALEVDGVIHGSVATAGLDKPFMFIDAPWIVAWKEPENEGAEKIRDLEAARSRDTARMWTSIADAKDLILTRCGGIRVLFEGVCHWDFSDKIFMSPWRRLSHASSVPPQRVALILGTYIVAFFRQTLCNVEQTILIRGVQPFPETKLEIWERTVIEENARQPTVC